MNISYVVAHEGVSEQYLFKCIVSTL
jgi:hypothetical protein